jgi:hypothetical protein
VLVLIRRVYRFMVRTFGWLALAAVKEFWRDYDQIAHDGAAMLRLEAGRNPHDPT